MNARGKVDAGNQIAGPRNSRCLRDTAMTLAGGFLALILVVCSTIATASEAGFPLEPPDSTSPRGTLFNLIDNVQQAHDILEKAWRDYQAAPGLFKSEAVRAQEAQARERLLRAAESLDLSEVRPVLLGTVRLEAVLQLKEVLDRIALPAADAVPGLQAVTEQGLTRWRVPHTAIDIMLVEQGPRAGEFLFDPLTVRQAGTLYRKVRQLPYVTPGTEGFYERYISSPGTLLPPKWLAWVTRLPDWTQRLHYGQTVWQWTALFLVLLALVGVLYALARWLRRLRRPGSEVGQVVRRLVVPVVAVLGLRFSSFLLDEQVSFTGQGLAIVLKLLLVPERVLEGYIAYLVSVLIAEQIISSPRIDNASLDANMIRMGGGVVGLTFGITLIFVGANELGVPLIPLIASLGVGGLAVALAARPTLENLIGGIILYVDRPVRINDFCNFGEFQGTVERIGVRSTQIRALDRTVITVPNATFADMEIINWARCDSMLILATIGLRYETKFEQLRYVLAKLREMCIAHPKIEKDTVRVRFVGYGSSSLDIQIRVYARTRDWSEFYAIQEDVFLRVGEIVEDAGASFAFPSRTLYMGRDKGLDGERGAVAAQEVQAWRRSGRLPFPYMARSQRERLADTLDYPPSGSPDSSDRQALEVELAEPLSRAADDTTQSCDPASADEDDGEPRAEAERKERS